MNDNTPDQYSNESKDAAVVDGQVASPDHRGLSREPGSDRFSDEKSKNHGGYPTAKNDRQKPPNPANPDISTSDESLGVERLHHNLREMSQLLQSQNLPEMSSRSSIMFANLCARQARTGTYAQPTLGSIFRTPVTLATSLLSRQRKPERIILQDVSGVVREGEMLLVLGRPNNVVSTFLKILGGQIKGSLRVNGEIKYNGVDINTFMARFRGDSVYTPDVDVHFPHLLVSNTLDFASETKTPRANLEGRARSQLMRSMTNIYTNLLGLQHTLDTKVGDEYVHGISGGERKRVSLAEALATRSSVTIWDNPTHGLDSSTSLEFIRVIRAMTRISHKTMIVALYQAGENLIKEFDKVTLLYCGSQIFFGTVTDAKRYFEDMGFVCHPQQTTADFLTAITDPTARRARDGWELRVPRSPDDFVRLWKESSHYRQLQKDLQTYTEDLSDENVELEKYEAYHSITKSKHQRQRSIYATDIPTQFSANLQRAFFRFIGDKAFLGAMVFSAIYMSLIMGSLFFDTSNSTNGFFSKGGALFFAILFNALQTLAEIGTLYGQRPIINRQKAYAMYHPFVDALASLLVEWPYKIVSVSAFDIVVYFMVGLKRDAGAFFILWLTTYLGTLTMSAYFRSIAAVTKAPESAIGVAGVSVLVFAIYTGYLIPKPSMHPWFKWITYINPLAYAFEILIANEFHDTWAPCASLVPSGPGYQNVSPENQVCAVTGSRPGQAHVSGDDYIETSFDYHYSHVWRNIGILGAFLCGLIAIFALATEFISSSSHHSEERLYYRRGHEPAQPERMTPDEEMIDGYKEQRTQTALTETNTNTSEIKDFVKSRNVFSWEDITYDITLPDGSSRRLLDKMTGYVKPGTLTALMGESGAGKTTLLRVLAERVNTGVVGGQCLVNGSPPGRSFRRMTGYVQQQDVHLSSATVREALQFSAKLRQPREVSLAEKLDYVEKVIEMLEMQDFAEAIIGTPGNGLNIEQRKRTTIAVELVAKPEILLFLDEPTSGLDSLSAWSIVRLLRKLADSGQGILCTIHQPSSIVFEQFDRLLLLARGGKPVYFGEIGRHAQTVIRYFEWNGGTPCPPESNPAEYILDVTGAGVNTGSEPKWDEIWMKSEEHRQVLQDIETLQNKYATDQEAVQARNGVFDGGFAESWWTQYRAVQSRLYLHFWRTPQYVISKIMVNVLTGLFLGFTFYKEDNSVQGLQNKLFAAFTSCIIAMPLMHQLQPQFFSLASLFTARERPSNMYHWSTFVLSSLISEVSFNLLTGTLFFFPWYFGIGFSRDWPGSDTASRGVYIWLQVMAFEMWFSTFAIAIGSLAPNAQTASALATLFASFVVAFNGVLQPLSQLPEFWHFMYHLTPYTYLLGGVVSTTLHGVRIVCEPKEINIFQPPTGQTCGEYAGAFAHVSGQLFNPDSTSDCEYCRYATGDQYLETRNMYYSEHWRNLGIMLAYVVFNAGIAFIIFYLAKVATFHVRRSILSLMKNKKNSPTETTASLKA
ncbi:uncharacterized protein Z518_04831 [Rhinocladiella mackenziei CBS 650.93]|uniref:ABC transporter domain-containing protein n=1 Tax=Rhinocladiella mackenziei CBS 650.93 TaxID=1442369 RepID=A0A0D2JCL6_9EURO|nr:uncharacterized protein Z518_04831 [Rhinocladiella mackenziei CBS 650.93]KIX06855.1 hypothetical protein Z518_04831 [Rhinocladiella mackenziei CBS 650.93]